VTFWYPVTESGVGNEVMTYGAAESQKYAIAVGKNDEAVLRFVFARLLFADEWILVFGRGFEYKQGKALGVEQEKVDETFCAFFEVGAERVEVCGLDRDAGFKANVGGRSAIRKETPASRFEQLIDLDAGCGFLVGHSASYAGDGGLAASMATIGGDLHRPLLADCQPVYTDRNCCGRSRSPQRPLRPIVESTNRQVSSAAVDPVAALSKLRTASGRTDGCARFRRHCASHKINAITDTHCSLAGLR
jgi:hypothetical protein